MVEANAAAASGLSHKIQIPAMLTNPDCGNADSLFYGIVWEFPHFLFLFFCESEFPKKFWEYVFPESGFVSIAGIRIFMGQTAGKHKELIPPSPPLPNFPKVLLDVLHGVRYAF